MPATVGLCERREPPGEWPDPTPQAEGSAAPQAVTESTEFAPVAQLGEHGKSRRMRRPVRIRTSGDQEPVLQSECNEFVTLVWRVLGVVRFDPV